MRWRLVLAGVTAITWVCLLRLAHAFVTSDLSLRLVAETSRRTAPWPYRLAGLWGSAEGSLLLFAGIVAVVATVAAWRATRRQVLTALATVAALDAIVLGLTDPFERLPIPALDGFGLTPILEHPAMAVHPPLLYAGLAMTLPAVLAVVDREGSTIDARRWLLGSVAVLTVAMAIGGFWSYAEQGWGGYWAWDPVENTSLAPWLAGLVALHARPGRRPAEVLLAAPWLLVLYGSALARAGSATSIHAFADAASVGWSLLAVAGATTAGVALATSPWTGDRPREPLGLRLAPIVLLGAVLVVVIVFTAGPVVLQAFGRPPGRVAAERFNRFTVVIAAAVVIALTITFVRARRRAPASAWVAHLGAVLLIIGVVGSSFDRAVTATLSPGRGAAVAGVEVVNRGVEVRDGDRPGSTAVVAVLDVDGRRVEPALVAHPDRGGVLTETALVSRPWRDVQVVLVRALDDGQVLLEVRVKPVVQLVWMGAAVIALGALLSLRRHRPDARRRVVDEPAAVPAVR